MVICIFLLELVQKAIKYEWNERFIHAELKKKKKTFLNLGTRILAHLQNSSERPNFGFPASNRERIINI